MFDLTLEQIRVNFGMAIVWTRLPLIMRRISMESDVKARMYGKAHTEIMEKYIKSKSICEHCCSNMK